MGQAGGCPYGGDTETDAVKEAWLLGTAWRRLLVTGCMPWSPANMAANPFLMVPATMHICRHQGSLGTLPVPLDITRQEVVQ